MESNIVQMMPKAPQRSEDDARLGGGDGGDGMDLNDRMTSIERAQIQTGMDLAYIKGRVEDMPTKDWFNTRLMGVFGGLAVFISVALGILGALLA